MRQYLRGLSLMATRKYTHLELGKDIAASIAGYYTPEKEVRLKYNGREVLYVTGRAVVEAACCGVANWGYALVPGYIVRWQGEKNQNGLPVTEVEPILDKETQQALKQVIESQETVTQVQFW